MGELSILNRILTLEALDPMQNWASFLKCAFCLQKCKSHSMAHCKAKKKDQKHKLCTKVYIQSPTKCDLRQQFLVFRSNFWEGFLFNRFISLSWRRILHETSLTIPLAFQMEEAMQPTYLPNDDSFLVHSGRAYQHLSLYIALHQYLHGLNVLNPLF